MSDERRVGLEDPDNPALVDDASIAAGSVRGVAYLDPRQFGGRSLNRSAGLGEPLNVIGAWAGWSARGLQLRLPHSMSGSATTAQHEPVCH
jgi:hypothetical protein